MPKKKVIRDTPAENVPIEYNNSARLQLPEDVYECEIESMEEMNRMSAVSHKQDLGALMHFIITDGPYKGQKFDQFFTNKLTKRSKLTVLCRGVWGGDFEPEEMAQIRFMKDLSRFILHKPVQVIILMRFSPLSQTYWYDIAFFLKSKFYDETKAKVILPIEDPIV